LTSDRAERHKRRGIRASRAKLEHALAGSDLPRKTQAALADRIADREGLESIPRDLVSRVFREQPVDAHSIERVARALEVDAASLYLAAPEQTEPANALPPPRARRHLVPAGAAIAAALVMLVTALSPVGAEMRCRLGEWVQPLETPGDRLGAVIARFTGGGENPVQSLLARSLAGDRTLHPYLSVLATCRRYRLTASGDLVAGEAALRARARAQLETAGAQILLWGEMRGETAYVRFISQRPDIAPITLNIGGQAMRLEESRTEIAMPLARPEAAISEIKAMLLGLMAVDDPERARMREAAMQAYAVSLDWLRASVVALRNQRRRIDPGLDPRRWGEINNQLCYEERLLGDVDGEAARYDAALAACRDALKARPRALFPAEWARTRINLASARIRLHNFAPDRTAALRTLSEAEADLLAAAERLDRRLMPQLRALALRNLGVVYERMGELSSGSEADARFIRAAEVTREALAVLNPDFQPIDWAITQQNLCLALYQHGLRQDADRRRLVEEARRRCALAKERLSRDRAPLSWAMVQNNYAVTLAILAEMDARPEGLRAARTAFAEAQQVYTRSALPANWAEVEINLAELSCHIARAGNAPDELATAEAHGEAALEVLIAKSLTKYRRYTEQLLRRIRSCRRVPIADCRCRAG